MWYVIGGIVFLFVAFIVWRWTSVGRGARQRDERLLKRLDPIMHKLDTGESVSKEEILELAQRPEIRFMLFTVLNKMNHSELIPSNFNSLINQAESALTYWLMHPNELQDPPESIEHMQAVSTSLNSKDVVFHVFRYRIPESHWAGKDGWLLGLAGPMDEKVEPYSFMPGAFSRCNDTEDSITPEKLVQWYVDMLSQKFN